MHKTLDTYILFSYKVMLQILIILVSYTKFLFLFIFE